MHNIIQKDGTIDLLTFSINKSVDLTDFNNKCYDFLWKGKRDKIKRSAVIAQTQDGDLVMIDIHSFILSRTSCSKFIIIVVIVVVNMY